jgi:hypothetical protein
MFARFDFAFIMILRAFLSIFLQHFSAYQMFKFNRLIKILIKFALDFGSDSFIFLSPVLSNIFSSEEAFYWPFLPRCIMWGICRSDGSMNTPAISLMGRNCDGRVSAAARCGTHPI